MGVCVFGRRISCCFLAEQEANERRRWHSDKKDTFSVNLQTKTDVFLGRSCGRNLITKCKKKILNPS